jgi:hypothetical protein
MEHDMKKIWYRNELPIAKDLMEFQKGLIEDFMKGYNTLDDAINAQCVTFVDPKYYNESAMTDAEGMLTRRDNNTKIWKEDFYSWKGTMIRNLIKINNVVETDEEISIEDSKKYPTAMRLLEKYREGLYGLVYSAMAPYTILHRHTGPENIDGKYVRIHIPLVIPTGDLFLELEGTEITWDNIFGFNNQYLHSAHNYSNEWRLIMMVDIDRELAGLSPGQYYKEKKSNRSAPFVRGVVIDN